jgi:hypothetical protein
MELSKRHLSINAEKHLALGKYASRRGTSKFSQDRVARCMKHGDRHQKNGDVSVLMKLPPIERRGFAKYDSNRLSVSDTSKSLVDDGRGNMIPDVPGITVPLGSLASDHPARMYLAQRSYNIEDLEAQFGADFCTHELPEDAEKSRFYKRFSDGFRDTPQNRIMLYGWVHGVRRIWQGRYIELVRGDYKYILHPYKNEMPPVAFKSEGKWQPLPGYEKTEFDPAKYKTAFGAKRNDAVLGFDAAVAWNRALGRSKGESVVAVTEGPLDAARLFPFGPAVAVLGKHMSHNQAALLTSEFGHFVLVGQNDEASQLEAMPKWVYALNEFTTNIKYYPVPKEVKDVGELRPEVAAELYLPFLL